MTDPKTTDLNEPHFDVIWPLSRKGVKETSAAPRLPDLNGKVVVELWDRIFRGEVIYPLVREYIRARFPGVTFVEYTEVENIYGPREHAVVAGLEEQLGGFRADAVIVGLGA